MGMYDVEHGRLLARVGAPDERADSASWNTDIHSIPDPAIVLCMNGTYGIRYFSGPNRRNGLIRGFETSEDARAFVNTGLDRRRVG